ncbi:MAG: amidohydrolase family protein [Chloroflexi bacterium]|nr:amidohydrolase family protein [Chloroflexota bacterium]
MRTILLPEWLVDGTGAPAQIGRAVVINERLIEAIVPAAAVAAAPGDQTKPLPGMTLMPGLINNHVHLVLPGDNTPFFDMNPLSDATLALRAAHNTRTALRAGVTTVRDCGARGALAIDVRDAQARGHTTGARVIACGWPITITGGHTRNFGGEADNADGLRTMVRRKISLGADFVKVMASGGGTPGSLPNHPSYTTEELRVIVDTAHGLGKKVVAHCICVQAIENAVDAGVDFIEHAMFTTPDRGTVFDERVADKLARSGIVVTPTMQVFRDLRDMLPPGAERDGWVARNDAQRQVVSRLRGLGVPLLAGSDAGWRATAFDTFWKELDELVTSGLSPVTAVAAASGTLVRAWGIAQYGIVEPGRSADLVVVEGNVAVDIKCVQKVKQVFQAGAAVL